MRSVAIGTATLTLAFGAATGEAQLATPLAQPAPFSQSRPAAALGPWLPVTLGIGKRPTRYDLVNDSGTVVLHAVADNAAGGLACRVTVDLRQTPIVAWRWKIAGLIADADSYTASREDAPARILLEFDGDKSRLTVLERTLYRIGKQVIGRELPYATLVYIWSNRDPVGTVIPSPYTRRIQMIVATSGSAGVGVWQSLARDARADFRHAFGEEPGRLTSVGVLTDTDNTDGHAEAWYGDIRFIPEAAAENYPPRGLPR